MSLALYALAGALFGLGLLISGMANPAKVLAFLDLRHAWDPSLALVMAGAIGTFAPLNLLIHRRSKPLLQGTLPGPRATGDLDRPLFLGAALFGIGWGLAGICPGPALVDLAALHPRAPIFFLPLLLGLVSPALIRRATHGSSAEARARARARARS